MESDGPYSVKNYKYRWCVDGLDKEHTLNQFRYKKWAEWWASQLNTARAEGRKEAESYTAKMLKFATDEVRKCHTEIRRLEDKYARNFYRMPIPLDEELAKKARGIE